MPFALRNTYAHFKRNPWCGGLTGELRVERPYRNFLTSVQYMEWKVGCGVAADVKGWCISGREVESAHQGMPVHVLLVAAKPMQLTCLTCLPVPHPLQVSHLLNKPIESICGYLTVLPGAFSAFRWAAVEVRFWPAVAVASWVQVPASLPAPRMPAPCSIPPHISLPPTPASSAPPTGRAAAPLLLRSLLPERPQRV